MKCQQPLHGGAVHGVGDPAWGVEKIQRVGRGRCVEHDEVETRALLDLREPLATQPSPLNLASAPAIGPEAAPIQVVVFGDFQCPFSSRLVPILDRIGRTFEGKMRLHFKHFPQEFHPQAQATAQAAVCAHEQGKFWDLYRQMFDLEKQKDLSPGAVRRYAGDAGLDMAAFDACASSDGPAKVVAADLEEARAAGVKGTPTVFVNGRRFSPSTGYNDRSFMRLFNGILE